MSDSAPLLEKLKNNRTSYNSTTTTIEEQQPLSESYTLDNISKVLGLGRTMLQWFQTILTQNGLSTRQEYLDLVRELNQKMNLPGIILSGSESFKEDFMRKLFGQNPLYEYPIKSVTNISFKKTRSTEPSSIFPFAYSITTRSGQVFDGLRCLQSMPEWHTLQEEQFHQINVLIPQPSSNDGAPYEEILKIFSIVDIPSTAPAFWHHDLARHACMIIAQDEKYIHSSASLPVLKWPLQNPDIEKEIVQFWCQCVFPKYVTELLKLCTRADMFAHDEKKKQLRKLEAPMLIILQASDIIDAINSLKPNLVARLTSVPFTEYSIIDKSLLNYQYLNKQVWEAFHVMLIQKFKEKYNEQWFVDVSLFLKASIKIQCKSYSCITHDDAMDYHEPDSNLLWHEFTQSVKSIGTFVHSTWSFLSRPKLSELEHATKCAEMMLRTYCNNNRVVSQLLNTCQELLDSNIESLHIRSNDTESRTRMTPEHEHLNKLYQCWLDLVETIIPPLLENQMFKFNTSDKSIAKNVFRCTNHSGYVVKEAAFDNLYDHVAQMAEVFFAATLRVDNVIQLATNEKGQAMWMEKEGKILQVYKQLDFILSNDCSNTSNAMNHVIQLAKALYGIHSLHLIHGDLHLGNIGLLNNSIVVFDLGKMNPIHNTFCVPYKSYPKLVAPDAHFSQATDVWCFGIAMVSLFTGLGIESLGKCATAHGSLQKMVHAKLGTNKSVPLDLILRTLDNDPRNRPTMAQIVPLLLLIKK